MSYEPDNWDAAWQGLEPKPPRRPRWGLWIGLLLLLALIILCAAGGWYAWQRVDAWLNGGSGVILPTPAPLDGTATADPNFSESSTPFSIAPTVTLPGAVDETSSVIALPQTSAPQIDGFLTEWEGFPSVTSPYVVYSIPGLDDNDSAAAEWWLGWDADNLYVAATVSDDAHVQTQTGNTIFKGDSLSLQLDTNREGDFGPQVSPDDFQIDLSPGDFLAVPPSAFRFQGTNDNQMVDAPGHNISLMARPTDSGYTLEAAIPWSNINMTPAAGLVIGAALNVNDNDKPGTAVQEVMKSHVATRQFRDPTTWGTLRISE